VFDRRRSAQDLGEELGGGGDDRAAASGVVEDAQVAVEDLGDRATRPLRR
jgi:hypothetical protein